MAHLFGKILKLSKSDMRIILLTGMAAGFGAVFGTPVTGAIFALEVLAVGRIKYDALIPCLVASLLADIVCRAWGIDHTQYHILFKSTGVSLLPFIHFDFALLTKTVFAGVAFGLASYGFATLSHGIKDFSNKHIREHRWLIPVLGGFAIIALTSLLGTTDYLGLGVTTEDSGGVSIVNAFVPGGATDLSWFWKLLFTAITLGTGYKGGEVTPLFFIGATLGNTIAVHTGAPIDLFAGLGFIAVFAGATNTPLACTIMGAELFGADNLSYYAVACFTAYYFSGHASIYQAQRVAVGKHASHSQDADQLEKIKDYKHAKKD